MDWWVDAVEWLKSKYPALRRILLAALPVLPAVVYVGTVQEVWGPAAAREEAIVTTEVGHDVLVLFGLVYASWAVAVFLPMLVRPRWARVAIIVVFGAAAPAWVLFHSYGRIAAVRCGGERFVLQYLWPRPSAALEGRQIESAGMTEHTPSQGSAPDDWLVRVRDARGRELVLGNLGSYDGARHLRDLILEQQYRARVDSPEAADAERTVELNGLGHVLVRLGRPWEARSILERALAAGAAAGAIRSESLVGLARIELQGGGVDRAADFYKQALAARRAAGVERDETDAVLAGEYETVLREAKKTQAADALRREYGGARGYRGVMELGLGKEEAARRLDAMKEDQNRPGPAP